MSIFAVSDSPLCTLSASASASPFTFKVEDFGASEPEPEGKKDDQTFLEVPMATRPRKSSRAEQSWQEGIDGYLDTEKRRFDGLDRYFKFLQSHLQINKGAMILVSRESFIDFTKAQDSYYLYFESIQANAPKAQVYSHNEVTRVLGELAKTPQSTSSYFESQRKLSHENDYEIRYLDTVDRSLVLHQYKILSAWIPIIEKQFGIKADLKELCIELLKKLQPVVEALEKEKSE